MAIYDDLKKRLSNTGKSLGNLGFNKYFFSPDVTKSTISKVSDSVTGIPTFARGSADALISRRYQPQIDAQNFRQTQLDNTLKAQSLKSGRRLSPLYGMGQQNLEKDILQRDLTTPEEMRNAATRLASTASMGLNLAPEALNAARPLVKLAGYGAIRGAENALPGAAVNLVTGKDLKSTAKQAAGDFATGAAFNTIMSPKLAVSAAKDVGVLKNEVSAANNAYRTFKATPLETTPIPGDTRYAAGTATAPKPLNTIEVPANQAAEMLGHDSSKISANARQGTVKVSIDPTTKTVASWDSQNPFFVHEMTGQSSIAPGFAGKESAKAKALREAKAAGKQRGFTTSVNTADTVSPDVKSLIKGKYTPKQNEQLMGEAKALLQDGASIDFKNTKDLDKKVAATIQEAINLDKAGNHEAAAALYNNLAEHGTNLGRGVQAFNLLEHMSPEAVGLSAAGQIKKFNRIHGTNIPELTGKQTALISEKTKQIMGLPAGREKNIAIQELGQTLSGFIPSSFADKALTVWKAGLLTSLRTHERNFLGNTIHGAAEVAKDFPAAATDALISTVTGKRSMSAAIRGIGEFGSKDTRQQMADIVTKGFDPTEQVKKFDYKRVTWAKTPVQQFLKKYTDIVFNTLGASDKPFYNAAMARSLYDQAGAEAINAGRRGDMAYIESLVKSPSEDMVKNAVIDANTATFKNKNSASQISSALKQAVVQSGQSYGGNVGGEIGKIVSEMTMPFTGVPSSILGQTIAYSPIGLTKGIVKTGRVLAGQVPELQRQAAQEVGRGVIGTGIFGLGAYLASKGLITGQPKDAEEARLWDAQNKPHNSILVDGKWRSLNSIGPEAIITLAGAKLNEELGKPDGSLATYGVSLGKDQLDQSFLSGVQAPINAITDPKRYAKSYAGGLLSSGIPNLVKDSAKALDPTQREMNTVLDYAQGNTPIARNRLVPKRDVLGNTMKQEPTGVNAFLDVFNSKTPNTGQVVNELDRLYNTGNGATPSKLNKSFTVFGQKLNLTPKELDKLEAESGGQITKRFQDLMNTPGYSELQDEEKAKLLNGIVDTVRGAAKKSLVASGNTSAEVLGTTSSTQPANRPTKDQLDIAKFQVEGDQQTRKIGDTYVYYDPNTGSAKTKTEGSIKAETVNQQLTNDLEAALKTKNYDAWKTAASKKYDILKAQNDALDPILDSAEILKNQNTMNDLRLKYLTYQGYGGLSKPKKGRKLKGTSVSKVTANRKPKLVKAAKIASPVGKQATLKKLSLSAKNGTTGKKRIRKSVI